MKALHAIAVIGLGLIGAIGSASAQYGAPDYGYGGREREYGRDRDYGYEERGRGYRERRPRDQDYGFNERAYLRCNPDVARAVAQGRMQSGFMHYQGYGRREGRRLSC
jgi:hypothetical protein